MSDSNSHPNSAPRQGRMTVLMPVYNEGEIIASSIATTAQVLQQAGIPHDFVLVDDGSKDATWAQLSALAQQRDNVLALKLSRNFGKEGAMFAGLAQAKGDCVVVMDCDMQHPPQVLPQMFALWQGGYQVVEGLKRSRGEESGLSRLAAQGFYGLLKTTSGIDLYNASDFRLMDRQVVAALNSMPERQTFFRAMSTWVGFTRTQVLFDVAPRAGGFSRFSPIKLFKLALDGITAFSAAPLHIVTFSGVLMLLLALVLGIQTLYMKLSGQAVAGFTTVLLLLLIIGSLLLIGLGIIGVYIARIYEEVKARPRYFVEKTAGKPSATFQEGA